MSTGTDYRVKKGNYYSYFGIGPESGLSSVRAFVAEMGFALPMRHKLPQVLPKKMPPGGKRMARLSDWLPFVTRPKAFDCRLDRSRATDGVPPPPLMPPHFPLANGRPGRLLL